MPGIRWLTARLIEVNELAINLLTATAYLRVLKRSYPQPLFDKDDFVGFYVYPRIILATSVNDDPCIITVSTIRAGRIRWPNLPRRVPNRCVRYLV